MTLENSFNIYGLVNASNVEVTGRWKLIKEFDKWHMHVEFAYTSERYKKPDTILSHIQEFFGLYNERENYPRTQWVHEGSVFPKPEEHIYNCKEQ